MIRMQGRATVLQSPEAKCVGARDVRESRGGGVPDPEKTFNSTRGRL